jgi:hypothetical protein
MVALWRFVTPVASLMLSESCIILLLALGQWRTLRIIVGGAKSYYMTVEGANLKYFVFYMVKKGKY